MFGLLQIVAPLFVLAALFLHTVAYQGTVETSLENSYLKRILLERVNRDRVSRGRNPVQFSRRLSELADFHCREMLEYDYISHWNVAGLKPYIRYSQGGVTDFTSENISSIQSTKFDIDLDNLERAVLNRHQGLLDELPPDDLHRRSILDPENTHVGIGIAYSESGLRLIEVFAKRYVEIDPLPAEPLDSATIPFGGRIIDGRYTLDSISVFYEPPPQPKTKEQLDETGPYSLPDSVQYYRLKLPRTRIVRGQLFYPRYEDGSRGEIDFNVETNTFSCLIPFEDPKPGIHTITVWLKDGQADDQGPRLAATHISISVM